MNWTPEQIASRGAKAKQGRVRNVAPKEGRTYNGRTYHSAAECRYAQYLDLLKKAGKVAVWEPQARFPLKVKGHLIATMVIDFGVTYEDGSYEAIEIKGMESDTYRIKRKLLRACFPKLQYTVIKAKDVPK